MLKIYTLICSIVLLVAAMLLLSGNFTMLAGVVFGFIAFGMIFAGMMCVLPYTVSHNAEPDDGVGARSIVRSEKDPRRRLSYRLNDWLVPSGVEVGSPRFH